MKELSIDVRITPNHYSKSSLLIFLRALGLLRRLPWVAWALSSWSARESESLGPDFISVRTVLDVVSCFLLLLWRTCLNCLVSESTPLPTIKKASVLRLGWCFHDEESPSCDPHRCTREERQLQHCSLGHGGGFLWHAWANHWVQPRLHATKGAAEAQLAEMGALGLSTLPSHPTASTREQEQRRARSSGRNNPWAALPLTCSAGRTACPGFAGSWRTTCWTG